MNAKILQIRHCGFQESETDRLVLLDGPEALENGRLSTAVPARRSRRIRVERIAATQINTDTFSRSLHQSARSRVH